MTSSSPRKTGGSAIEDGRSPPDSVVVARAPSGEIMFSNRYAERVVGRLMSEIADDFPMLHLDGRPYSFAERQVPRSLASGEEIVDEEFLGLAADGSLVHYRCSCWPVYDDGGQIVAAVAVTRDVTEQKRQEERLAYLAGLLENTEDAVVALDEGYFLTVWNAGAERLYGWTASEVVGRHANEVARTNLSEEERSELRRELAENGRWRGEVTVARKDGTTVEAELISVALRGPQREITGYLTIHRDISERKRSEEALRAAQRRSETILESISDKFSAVDREWRYTYINERALAQARSRKGRHLTRDDVLGMTCWEFLPELVGTTIDREFHRAMREQRPVEFEAYSEASDNWLELRAYPSEEGLSIYAHDISARKRAEEELSRRAEQQALVAELGQRALASEDLRSVFDEAVGLVARTLDVELAGVAEVAAGSEEVILRAGVGWRADVVGSQIEPGGRDSQVGYTLLRGEPVIAEDQAADPRFKPSVLAQAHGVVSALSVMIASPDEPFGVLEALSTTRRTFSPADVSFVQAVANVLESAVERSRAHARLTEVREAERSRIARDLHDEALRDLTDALVLAGATGSVSNEREAVSRLARLRPALRRVGEQLRGAIYGLRLGGDEDRPFPELLGALVDVDRAMALDCEVELELRDGVPTRPLGATGTELLRVLGEALTNARRHSGARHVRVRVWGSERRLHAEVSDDGRGFDPVGTSPAAKGSGIKGMRERADLIHGELAIRSEPDVGTSVRIDVLLPHDGEELAEPVRVLLVEDHASVRQAIASAFEREAGFEVVGEAASLAEARGMLADVDVAVLDLALPDGCGADLIKELRTVSRRAQALVLSATLDRAEMARAVQSGAAGVLSKTTDLDDVVDAVRRLRAGETLLPPDEIVELLRFASRQREREHDEREALAELTPREREILQALAEGLDSRRIADRLHISIRTARNHINNILAKLGVHSQLQALVLALQYDIVEIPKGQTPAAPTFGD
ncbi:MAG: PAS domain S-box protein [Thermoleophilaceae bacterium]